MVPRRTSGDAWSGTEALEETDVLIGVIMLALSAMFAAILVLSLLGD
jgi:hypothetical protein